MMKKILFFLLLAVFTLGISAQGPSKKCPVCGLSIPKCQYKGKHPKKNPKPTPPVQQQPSKPSKPVSQPSKPTTSKPKPITVSRPTGTIEGHGYVDLGLSVKWATKNVGASSPSDYGGYYAWGETRPKSRYDWDNCFDCLSSTGGNWRTYNNYKIGSLRRLTPTSGHDTARENWGGTWRMPTDAEIEELCNKCTWTWIYQGGLPGYKVTGSNGNSIFLPAAGWRNGTDMSCVGEVGEYWSSSLNSSDSGFANQLFFTSRDTGLSYTSRKEGHSVRPVTE